MCACVCMHYMCVINDGVNELWEAAGCNATGSYYWGLSGMEDRLGREALRAPEHTSSALRPDWMKGLCIKLNPTGILNQVSITRLAFGDAV